MPTRLTRTTALWLVLGGIASVQLGAAVSKHLFDLISPTAMVWLRLATSTLVLLALARPRLRGRTRQDWLVALGFGLSLALMNWAIYQSFARIPLGVAVTIEFVGPLTIAVAGSRRKTDLVWVALAGAGVALLGFKGEDVTFAGVAFALLAATGWAAYILLSKSTGQRWPGLSGLAMASLFGTLVLAPFALAGDGSEMLDAKVLLFGALVGLLSSVIPYSFELNALRVLPPRVFGILMSLEPAAAALVGILVLSEFLGVLQWLAIACVVVASVGATRTSPPSDPGDAPLPVL